MGASKLLAMAQNTKNLHPIVISKVFFQLISQSIVLQLQRPLQEHLSLNQFKISTPKGVRPSFLASKPSLTYTLIGL
jgi:hypothetical protein